MNKDVIRKVVNGTDHAAGKVFAFIIQSLILLSLVTFSIHTIPNLSAETREILRIVEIVTVAIFTLEYVLRLVVAENKIRFAFSFYGLIDLAAILPFYIATGLDLRAVRIFRFLRLVRILKLLKYNQAITRFQRALMIAREELTLFGCAAAILLYLSAVGIYYFESTAQPAEFTSVFHSLWWAITTLTTVGYGDMYPITMGGRIFTCCVLLVGLGVVAVPTGILAAALSQARDEEIERISPSG